MAPAHTVAVSHYVAVRLVAVLQSAFRAVIREVVDYNARKDKSLPKIEEKITLQMVNEFAKNAVTVGEFVSHLMPLNSFGQMQSSFELATGTSLKIAVSPHLSGNKVINVSFARVSAGMQELFRERNIICHEIRDNEVISKETLGKWFASVLLIVSALAFYAADFVDVEETPRSPHV
jgi:hypothetical protein